MDAFADAGRVTFLATAAGVGPGMLTWPAWQAVRDAGEVLGRDVDPRWVQALADAGVVVTEVPEQPVVERAQRLLNTAREGAHVVWLVSEDGDPGLGEAVTAAVLRSGQQDVEVQLVLGSYELDGDERTVVALQEPGIAEAGDREDGAVRDGGGSEDAGILDAGGRQPWAVPDGGDRKDDAIPNDAGPGDAGALVAAATTGARLIDLVQVMDRLRSPGGCPWDASQTHQTLVPYAIEEAFELAEAVETGDRDHLREELGDLLLQVVFHARVAAEDRECPFDIDDVAAGIVTKLRRRHPHVFGPGAGAGVTPGAARSPGVAAAAVPADAPVAPGDGSNDDGAAVQTPTTPEEVETSWHAIKAAEKGRASVLDGIPLALPALARAEKVLARVDRARLPVQVGGHVQVRGGAGVASSEELGERLLALVAAARTAGLDPEAALRAAVRDVEAQARAAERG